MALIIVLRNTSGLAPVSDYDYQVRIGSGSPNDHILETGTVRDHSRTMGWEVLLRQLLDERQPDQKDT